MGRLAVGQLVSLEAYEPARVLQNTAERPRGWGNELALVVKQGSDGWKLISLGEAFRVVVAYRFLPAGSCVLVLIKHCIRSSDLGAGGANVVIRGMQRGEHRRV